MFVRAAMFGACLFGITALAAADDAAPDAARIQAAREKAINYLKTAQASDGSWTSPQQPGISGLVTYALLLSEVSVDDPAMARALAHLTSFRQPDGGLYSPQTAHKNYETSIIVLALTAANSDGRYDDHIRGAVAFLKQIQWDGDEGSSPDDPAFGGQGYGSHKRPDLSNTSFFLDALKHAGVPEDDEAFRNAIVFVSRCQNLETEHNTTPFATKVNDGGFYYTPAAGGSSQAGETPDGGLRSYASMTYAGLKSMIYAGLSKDDPRVAAASEWIRRFYTFQENPGMGQQGLFYYFQTVAKTLHALGSNEFVDAEGTSHAWRRELSEQILSLQKSNGGWLNPTDRWYEGDPNLATGYCLIALHFCVAEPAAVP
ncbi:MAG: terpene cyclase/mutase family protein [Planctomyces sp.]|nr:terpene cyclase/mutase family protein [Planctomyces sp.]